MSSAQSLSRRLGWAWFDNWFGPKSPIDLACLRIVFYGYGLWNLSGSHEAITEFNRALYHPISFYRWLPPPSSPGLDASFWLMRIAMLLAFLGVAFRPAAIVAALAGVYHLGLLNNFAKVNHSANLYAIGLAILACSRAGDALSVRAWLSARKGRPAPPASGDYRWPIQAILLSIACMYCSAGVSKLVNTGWDWAFSNNLRLLLLRHHFTHSPPTELGLLAAQYPALCQWLAFGALVLELLCPLMLFGRYTRALFGGGLFSLQASIYLTLGVLFRPMVPVFLALVPFEWLGRLGVRAIQRLRRRASHRLQVES